MNAAPGQRYPRLSPETVARISTHGRSGVFDGGEYLYEVGDRDVDFFVVLDGAVDILESDGRGGHILITTHDAGQFTGELNLLAGRAVLVCARAQRRTRVLRFTQFGFRNLVRAEPDVGEIILRAFVLRRVWLREHVSGSTIIVGAAQSACTLRIQSFLIRNGYPQRLLDISRDPLGQEALKVFHIDEGSLPVVILGGEKVLVRPSNHELAGALGINEELDPSHAYDVAVIGAGPAGLAAAVYAASEGLDTVVIEAVGPGGQAGSSSKIENYLGFPTGISGQDLADRAQVQAQKFGARLVIASAAVNIDCSGFPYGVDLEDGNRVAARSVVIATGARYRRLNVPNLRQFEGLGVHYAATAVEGRLCAGSEVVVVGAGNSAGQAAVFLASTAQHVHMVVRGNGLAETMSDYLVTRIQESPRITVHPRCEVTSLIGRISLEAVCWRQSDGNETKRPASNIFPMVGAVPNTDWLTGTLGLDSHGFIKTDHAHEQLSPVSMRFATSVPGIFAVGDCRSGSIKRVAAGVGEGAMVIHAIHQWLRATS
jgi:thioredoxin reductase (NADPH)